ncbi:hypothetical protein [Brucella rhizosphaerae]|uniref:hypothetical protein n=1 Tax=Brucella rhizosphaerae TaxID=571254 RepID=UPI001FCB2491|nr:hypothetical protein [Brucella rhizosphaerae]
MKRIIVVLSLLTATVAHADDKPVSDEFCTRLGSLAANIMKARQSEAPMSELIARVSKHSDDQVWRKLVVSAYESPAYASDQAQKGAIDAFRNKIELQCFKSAN